MSPIALICKVVLSVTVCTSHSTHQLTTQEAAAILAANQTQVFSAAPARDYWYPSVRSTSRETSSVTVNVNVMPQPYDLQRDLIARGLRLPGEQFGALVFRFPRSQPSIIKRKQ